VVSKENEPEGNSVYTNYMVMSRDQNEARCHSIKKDNCFLERVEEFKIFENNLTK